VNALSAGPIKTLSGSAVKDFDKMLEMYNSLSPLRRNVELKEIGKTAVYLLSDMSTGVTGETLHVDSGYHVMGAPHTDASTE
jgi:enoyl-[acyl-carrier protein] reductase I